jgi:uncharacterized membrane protein
MSKHTFLRSTTLVAAAFVVLASVAAHAAPQGDGQAEAPGPRKLVYAVYKSETAAMEVWRALRSAEDSGAVRIESYAVVSKAFDGKVTVKDQRGKGARAGVVVGALVGLLGGPAGVVAGAAAGGAVGYLTGNAVGMSKASVDRIKNDLHNGESAIIAVVEDRWASSIERMEETRAANILVEGIPMTAPGKDLPTPLPPTPYP